jgi:hypothetical protein
MIWSCPTWQHESLTGVVSEALQRQPHPRVKMGGSPDLKLFKKLGIKCPDLVLYDDRTTKHAGFPTIVFEVGYSQSQASLNFNAARLLFGSRGKINAVINVKVAVAAEEKGKERVVKSLVVDVWRMLPCEVNEKEVETFERDRILTKEHKPASSKSLTWSFSYITTEKKLFHLKARPRRYQVSCLAVNYLL